MDEAVDEATFPAPVSWSEQTVFEALRTHFVENAVALLPQVASETGASPRRTADAIAMQLWPSRGLTIEGIEIKVSRSDLLREYDQPEKSDVIAQFCDKWWIAAPPGVVRQSDLDDGTFPKSWGYLEVEVATPGLLKRENSINVWVKPHTFKVKVRKKAEENKDAKEPTRKFLAALMRSLQAHESPEALVERRLSVLKAEVHTKAYAHREAYDAKKDAEVVEIRRRVQQFEYATGMSTGVFEHIWDDSKLRKIHEKQRRLIQIANGVEHTFERAKELATWLESRADEMKKVGAELRQRAEPAKVEDHEETA